MGYWTVLTLVGVQVPKTERTEVRRAIKGFRNWKTADMQIFLSNLGMTPACGLEFRGDEKRETGSYFPYDNDDLGFTQAMEGKWSGDNEIARWLASHRAKGLVSFHSLEGDGAAWGYQLDGAGRFRLLDFAPSGRWISTLPRKKPPARKATAKKVP
jgi:hypothetical protein